MEQKKQTFPQFETQDHKNAYILYKTIVLFYETNLSLKQIADIVDKSKSSIQKTIEKFRKHANVHMTKYDNCGRSNKIITEDNELAAFIKEQLKQDNFTTQNELMDKIETQLKIKVSQTTLSRHLREIGSYKNSLSTPIISEKNKIKRLDFATFHQKDKLTNVIFSDESRFELYNITRKPFVFKNEETPKYGKINPNYSIMVWGAISARGKVGFCIVDGMMNGEKYIQVLKNNLIQKANKLYSLNKWRFQQDNAPCHKSYFVKEWLSDNVPKIINHPPQSPDLNAIEMIWAIMKNRMSKLKYNTITQLQKAVYDTWNGIEDDIIINCIEHTRKVMQYVRENDGKFCKIKIKY